MFYCLYQITNLVNGKIYVGVHKTKELDDGYMGSGKVIQYAIEKYGLDSFEKVILETFEDAEAMYAREKEVVTDEFLLREDTYNLRRGGFGGWDHLNNDSDIQRNKAIKSNNKKKFLSENDADWLIKNKKIMSNTLKEQYETGSRVPTGWHKSSLELAQTTEAKRKRKETQEKISFQKGENNSQFGTTWISHELFGYRKCKKDLIPEYIEQGWYKGRSIMKYFKGVSNG